MSSIRVGISIVRRSPRRSYYGGARGWMAWVKPRAGFTTTWAASHDDGLFAATSTGGDEETGSKCPNDELTI
jgi:hypothetical protein